VGEAEDERVPSPFAGAQARRIPRPWPASNSQRIAFKAFGVRRSRWAPGALSSEAVCVRPPPPRRV